MNVDQVKASYRRMLGEFETVVIRRYSGTAGARTHVDFPCLAKPAGYAPTELVGAISEGDVKIYAFVDDLVAAGLSLPISTANDRAFVAGKEMAIMMADGNTIRLAGQTVAYILQARG